MLDTAWADKAIFNIISLGSTTHILNVKSPISELGLVHIRKMAI